MSMTTETKRWHLEYEQAEMLISRTVDEAYNAAIDVIKSKGMSVAGDDRAEKLVAAIMEYLTESAGE